MSESLRLKIGFGENGIEAEGPCEEVQRAFDKFLNAISKNPSGVTGGQGEPSDAERQLTGLIGEENARGG